MDARACKVTDKLTDYLSRWEEINKFFKRKGTETTAN